MTDLSKRLREYRSRNEWGDPERHAICDAAANLIDTQARKIEELVSERDAGRHNFHTMQGAAAQLLKRAEAAEAKIEELVKALEPFADFGEFMEIETEGFSDSDRLELVPEESDVRIGDLFVAAFRLARTTLSTIQAAKDGK